MKKIVAVYPGYLPGKRYGGPVTSLYHFSELLGDKYDIRIICKNHDFLDSKKYEGIKDGWNKVGKANVFYLDEKEFNGKSFKRIISELKPDLIYASSVFSAQMNIPLLRIAKEKNIPVILAPRGELSEDRIQSKAWKKIPYLHLVKKIGLFEGVKFQATSKTEMNDIIKFLSIFSNDIYLVPNVPCQKQSKGKYKKEKGNIKIVATSRLQSKNNQLYSIKIVNQMKSNVLFDIYGPKEDLEYWKRCEEEIAKSPNNIKINYKGILQPTEIGEIYLNYDCLLHPTHSENYGHVIVEALCHECPVVISKNTTPWDDLQDYKAGYACFLGKDRDFIDVLENIANMDSDDYSIMIKGTCKYSNVFELEKIEREYVDMITKTIN